LNIKLREVASRLAETGEFEEELSDLVRGPQVGRGRHFLQAGVAASGAG
jgi:hypothetical protein